VSGNKILKAVIVAAGALPLLVELLHGGSDEGKTEVCSLLH
jgi:hypothetical protein